jgi:hypothetical protein
MWGILLLVGRGSWRKPAHYCRVHLVPFGGEEGSKALASDFALFASHAVDREDERSEGAAPSQVVLEALILFFLFASSKNLRWLHATV